MNEADYLQNQLELFDRCECPPGGYIVDSIFLKMSPEYCQAIKEWTFVMSYHTLQTPKFQYLDLVGGQMQDWCEADSVMLGGESSILNISEAPEETISFPKGEEGYGLSVILEKPTDVPKKYFLSAKACRGILNRAKERGKELPPSLKKALEQQAKSSTRGGQNESTLYENHAQDYRVKRVSVSPTVGTRPTTNPTLVMESIPEAVVMGHDERSAKFNTEVTDPLTACDYKQPQIVAQMFTTGGQSAYAIGNGQADQLQMSAKVGALNCMHDQIAVMQKLVTESKQLEVSALMTDEDSTDKT